MKLTTDMQKPCGWNVWGLIGPNRIMTDLSGSTAEKPWTVTTLLKIKCQSGKKTKSLGKFGKTDFSQNAFVQHKLGCEGGKSRPRKQQIYFRGDGFTKRNLKMPQTLFFCRAWDVRSFLLPFSTFATAQKKTAFGWKNDENGCWNQLEVSQLENPHSLENPGYASKKL